MGVKSMNIVKYYLKELILSVIVIYASAPVQRVVGEFRINEIFSESVDVLWERTKEYSGISKEYYMSYFKHKDVANAIEIGEMKKYKETKLLSDYKIVQAPQSFCYISD